MKAIAIMTVAALLASCSPKIVGTITGSRPAAPSGVEVFVIGVPDPVPIGMEQLGEVSVGDTGFSVNCSYEEVIAQAKNYVRKAGGDILKLTEHKPPSVMGSSCHRIKGMILYSNGISSDIWAGQGEPKQDSLLYNEGCTVVHFYRFGGMGALVSYDMHANDETIGSVKNNSKTSLKLRAQGKVIFWARTESKAELEVDLQPGYHYYIRCSLDMGIMVGRPALELVDVTTGKAEYDSINSK